jgi:hypothetical protein
MSACVSKHKITKFSYMDQQHARRKLLLLCIGTSLLHANLKRGISYQYAQLLTPLSIKSTCFNANCSMTGQEVRIRVKSCVGGRGEGKKGKLHSIYVISPSETYFQNTTVP